MTTLSTREEQKNRIKSAKDEYLDFLYYVRNFLEELEYGKKRDEIQNLLNQNIEKADALIKKMKENLSD